MKKLKISKYRSESVSYDYHTRKIELTISIDSYDIGFASAIIKSHHKGIGVVMVYNDNIVFVPNNNIEKK